MAISRTLGNRYVSRCIAIVAAVSAVLVLSPLVFPAGVEVLFGEDGPVEMGGAIVFLLAAIVVSIRAYRERRWTLWYTAATAAGLLAFLSEVSFGERIFGFTPPRVADVHVDAVHDLFKVARRLLDRATDDDPSILLAGVGFGCIVLLTSCVLVMRRPRPPGAVLFVGSVPLVTAAIVIDLKIPGLEFGYRRGLVIEETIEFTASLLLLAFAVAPTVADRRNAAPRAKRVATDPPRHHLS
ncbi:hypothetical protein [Jannaschia sp. LMIT008]|uniref:hypothetical protein n=1 Tax=Jannaschia maritima TaxID=3032585 RepID=UPI0028124BEE|nr:hypothetical protein [Jannaschia sp. LMIT008]